jgi:uncharacterized protein (DUF2062 family)
MRRLARQKYQEIRAQSHRWLGRHPILARALEYTGCLGVNDHVVARGVAVGLFVGLTPTVGVQTLLMIAGCVLLRGNFPAAFLVSWVSNPLTMAPLYVAFNALGRATFEPLVRPSIKLTGLEGAAVLEGLLTLLGSLLLAVPISMLGYAVALWAWREFAHLRDG